MIVDLTEPERPALAYFARREIETNSWLRFGGGKREPDCQLDGTLRHSALDGRAPRKVTAR
jgi:hypothetical protein